MNETTEAGFADSVWAKVIALVLILACAAIIAWQHREAFLPSAQDAASANPQLDACIAERTGQVDKMRADGVIDDRQADSFRTRAIQFCQQQFPPQN
ncbi:hypothetical protein ACKTEK_03880 [Tepidamorphus sp. 3E244]|uniref:hypothetical protein n=1 Tax=Tepidamorphus sp. 3E244 TaxID=3385498 RepID=UPI0038FBE99B